MTDKEVMNLALDALESCTPLDTSSSHVIYPWYDEKLVDKAITALKERLAQPEQEPFAIVHIKLGCLVGSHRDQNKLFPDGQYGLWPVATPPAQPAQRTEQNFCSRCGKRTNDIHTCTPPKD
jgi:hypothetical protein